MTPWILILMLLGANDASVAATTVMFADQRTCDMAGKAAGESATADGHHVRVAWICSPYRQP
jgi:hypothetical protein